MNEIDFFRAICSKRAFFLEKVDDYFYLGGKKAVVIKNSTKNGQEQVILSEGTSSLLATVGKIISYFTLIIPLIMLIAKAILRSKYRFKLIDPKEELQKGVNISAQTVAKIQTLMPKILGKQNDHELEWLSTGNNLVFKLVHSPHLIFKFPEPTNPPTGPGQLPHGGNVKIVSRFEKMIKAKEVCLAHELGLLILPHAKKLTVNAGGNDYAFIVEESLDLNLNSSAQEEFYHKYSMELNETLRQLAIFIAKTGFSDVSWGNIPILNEKPGFKGPRSIGLIDVEDCKNSVGGFIGGIYNRSRGLIGCLSSKAQMDIVITEGRKQGVALTGPKVNEAVKLRLKELDDDKELRAFYIKKGIATGKEPVQVAVDSLDLDLTEEGQMPCIVGNKLVKKQTVTLRKATEDVVAEINRSIQNSSDEASTKGKRQVDLDTCDYPFGSYAHLGMPPGKMMVTNKEEEKQLWLNRIVSALVKKGHIFGSHVGENNCLIQA